MSDSLASSEIISKPIDAGVRGGGAVFKRRMPMRFSLVAAILPALVVCNAATAQVSGMASPTPTMGATSPLGIGTGSAVSQTGIPLGSTEIASPGVSPAPTVTGTIAMPSSGTTCSTLGTSPSSMFGSTASFDGGNVDLVGNVSDIGNVDNLGDAGNLGDVGNVRLRLEQYRLVVDSSVNVAHNAGWRRSNRHSDGIHGDWQSWC